MPEPQSESAGRWLHPYGVLPALVVAAWTTAGVALLLAHAFQPWSAVPVGVVVLLALLRLHPLREHRPPSGPRWALASTLLVVVLAGGWAASHASENLVVRRDPGPNGLTGAWIAQHGTMQIPTHAGVFGHLADLAYSGPAFYGGPGGTLQPQFMSGLPLALAPADWVGGLPWLLRANAVVGALALLTFAAFVARAVGPWAAPFATAALALTYPETHAMRSAYSEPLAQLLLFGGLCLLWDNWHAREHGSSRIVLLAGVVLGLTEAVRIDALAELLPMAAAVVVLALMGRAKDARAFTAGLLGGLAVGAVDGWLLHPAYVEDTGDELRLVGAAVVAVVVAGLVATRLGPRLHLSNSLRRTLGTVATWAIPAVAVALYTVRPYVEHPHSPANDLTAETVGPLQGAQHLTVDPHRTYAEDSLRWLGWWVGAPAILLAAIAAGLLIRRWLRGKDLPLLPAALTGLAVAALVLWRPSITPDHPWADRRFVPVVLPVMILLATWLLARFPLYARAFGALAVLVPIVVTTVPLAWTRTETGQLAALHAVCRRIPAHAAVLFVDAELAYRWAPAVRDECGVPTAYVIGGRQVDVAQVQSAVRASGRTTLVLLAGAPQQLAGRNPQHTVALTYPVDDRTLVARPQGLSSERTDVWTAIVGS